MENEKLAQWIFKVTVSTLALICVSTIGVLLIGLFEDGIDNSEIFKIITPAFNTVVGAFVGLLGGLSISRNKDKD